MILCNWYQKLHSTSQLTSARKRVIIPKGSYLKKSPSKGHYSEICNFILTFDFFGVKTVWQELSKLFARLLLVLLGIRVGLRLVSYIDTSKYILLCYIEALIK